MASAVGKKTSKVFVWIILILLIAGLAGFGVGGLGGTIRSIGNVGDTEISVVDYQRALQAQLNAEQQRQRRPISFSEATQSGLDLQVRTNLAATAALTEEVRTIGLSVSDAEVARELQSVPAFQGPSGGFDREAYEFALSQNGLRAKEFEVELRRASARRLLQQAITGGITSNPTHSATLLNFLAERRSFRWTNLDESLLVTPNAAPSDADINRFFSENEEQFMRPETRNITYAWLTPEMLLEQIEVEEADLQALYDERAGEYSQPERRLLDRLSFPDEAAATAAKAAIEANERSFESYVQERGLTLDDVDIGDASRDALDKNVADAVFAMTEPGIVGPIPTSLGPALFRINAVLEASETPFEDVRDELLAETTADRAQRDILDRITEIDDLLAGGVTLEEIVEETPMELGQIGFHAEQNEGIAAYPVFRREAEAASVDDFPQVFELSDGGIFAMRLDEIVPPTLPPLAEIRNQVIDAWDAAETTRRLSELAETLQAQMTNGTPMEALGLSPRTETDLSRSQFIEDAPFGLLSEVFGMEANEVRVVQSPNAVALVEMTNISPPDMDSEQNQQLLSRLDDQASATFAADVFELFGVSTQNRHGLQLDQTAINAVHQGFAVGGHGGN